jgi:uncharacterized protein (UPF0297 family)
MIDTSHMMHHDYGAICHPRVEREMYNPTNQIAGWLRACDQRVVVRQE